MSQRSQLLRRNKARGGYVDLYNRELAMEKHFEANKSPETLHWTPKAERLFEAMRAMKKGITRGILAGAVVLTLVPTSLSADQGENIQSVTPNMEGNKGGGTPNEETYIVKPGDTAWGIAREHLGHEADVRPLVDDIVGQAPLDGAPGLQPGEEIKLPKNN